AAAASCFLVISLHRLVILPIRQGGNNKYELRSSNRMPIMRCQLRVFSLLTFGVWLVSVAPGDAADVPAAIKEKAEICAGCHGENGISQTENIPSLAGQMDQFIQWQLVFFRGGARKNDQMQSIAQDITTDEIRGVGGYFASLPPP